MTLDALLPLSMTLSLYEKPNKYCNLTGKLFCVLKPNMLVQLKAVDGLDKDLILGQHHAQLNIILRF